MQEKTTLGRGRILFVLLSLAILTPIVSGTLSRAVAQGEDGEPDSIIKQLSVFTEVLSLIRRHYVEETSMADLFSGALDGTVDALDPLATYVPPESVEAYRKTRAIGSRHSGLRVARQRGITYVVGVQPGSPGETSGLKGGDIVTEIDQRSTRKMSLWQIETALAGDAGTELDLKILRRGQNSEIKLVLEAFPLSGPELQRQDGVAILRIPRFGEGIEDELATLLKQVVDEDRLLVDLRGTTSGSYRSAYDAASLFAQGLLGQLHGRNSVLEEFRSERAPAWAGRIVVLTDRSSQGPAEILVAVLRQAAAAEQVGERTFGHAARRSVAELSNGAEVYFSDAFYSGPDGEPIDQSLIPQVAVNEGSRRLSEAELPFDELMLRRAIELLIAEPEIEKAA